MTETNEPADTSTEATLVRIEKHVAAMRTIMVIWFVLSVAFSLIAIIAAASN
jgi:hypothetical protein